MYHRIDYSEVDPWALSVTPQHFIEQLEVLRQSYDPFPLRDLSTGLASGSMPQRGVVVTFDDGYADNLYKAKPALEAQGIPATVFIATGYTGAARAFWWDELVRILLHTRPLPDLLQLDIAGRAFRWEGGGRSLEQSCSTEHDADWRAWNEPRTQRQTLYKLLWQSMQPLRETERCDLIRELRQWADAELTVAPVGRALTHEELLDLSTSECIEIGAHTVTHPLLSTLSAGEQSDEIRQNKSELEGMLGQTVTQFAYPYGDHCQETIDLVQKAGFATACTTRAGAVDHRADRFQLPRIAVQDWDGDQFARALAVFHQ